MRAVVGLAQSAGGCLIIEGLVMIVQLFSPLLRQWLAVVLVFLLAAGIGVCFHSIVDNVCMFVGVAWRSWGDAESIDVYTAFGATFCC